MREAYKATSSIENGGRKSPIKIEIRKDFYLITVITVSFAILFVFEAVFLLFSGPFLVLPNVTAPTLFALSYGFAQTNGSLSIFVGRGLVSRRWQTNGKNQHHGGKPYAP